MVLIGPQDCQNFIDFLNRNEASYESEISQQKNMTKLFFATDKMKANFANFGDIKILDSTYNTNTYSIPLAVFSGIDNNYRNVLFGVGLMNDETEASYAWLIRSF